MMCATMQVSKIM